VNSTSDNTLDNTFLRIKSVLSGKEGQKFSTSDIQQIVLQEIGPGKGTNAGSVTPSDYCYNNWNLSHEKTGFTQHLFERFGHGKYRYLGENYPYTGLIYHRPKQGGVEREAGQWINGQLVLFGLYDVSANGIPEEVLEPDKYLEGAVKRISVNAYERSPGARRECIEAFGTDCQVCGINFGQTYGKIGNGFIHVHHLKPLAEAGEQYELDPITDLRPVCPNCHAMLHKRKPPYSVEELKGIVSNNQGLSGD
jgi:hypothetical protein